MQVQLNTINYGDAFQLIRDLPDASVDLIFTSPPYAQQRKNTYGGVPAAQYVDWFMPMSAELYRVLKPTGSFVMNLKEHCEQGERSIYVLELILALKQAGWKWTEEYIWHKSTSFPGYWPNRLRDAWERLLHFTKQKKFAMYQDSVKKPIGDWAKNWKPRAKDYQRDYNATQSGFSRVRAAWEGKDTVLPDNVLYEAPVSSNKGHSAVMPEAIAEFFVKLFTTQDDLVLDPFAGSGTTLRVAHALGRQSVGFEIVEPVSADWLSYAT